MFVPSNKIGDITAAWVIVGECFPLPIRARGVGVSTASNWFWNCIIAVITPYMVGNSAGSANLGPRVFFIWGSCCILSLAFAYFLVPEMKGLSLEQVDKMMEEVSPRKSAKWVPKTTFAAEMGHVAQRDKDPYAHAAAPSFGSAHALTNPHEPGVNAHYAFVEAPANPVRGRGARQ